MIKKLSIAGLLLVLVMRTFSADVRIHQAAYGGRVEAVRELLREEPDVDERDSYGGTALHGAMFQKNMEIVGLLIDYGYDIDAVGPRNGYTPLHDAVWADNLPAVKLLVEEGADTSIRNKEGETPYDKALREGKEDIAEYLMGRARE